MRQRTVVGGGGVRLNVVETGKARGRPILFIHGWSQSHLAWGRQLESPLAERYRLVAFDLRGHGESDKPEGAYADSALWAADVAAVIEELGLERPLLVGWSYGGFVISDYVRLRGQDALGALNLVGGATSTPDVSTCKLLGSAWAGVLPGPDGSLAGTVFSDDADESAAAMRVWLHRCFAEPLPAEEEHVVLGFNLECPSRVRLQLFGRTLDNDDVLRSIRVPTLVTHGDADAVVDIETGRHIAATVPGAKLSIYEGCGHAPFWEATERFNRELDELAAGL